MNVPEPEMSGAGMSQGQSPRLVIVCGLPGSGKTTRATLLESQIGAVRLCPDDWMDSLAINFHDSAARDRVEALQWKLTQDLLTLGQNVVIEWGTWGRSERDTLRLRARELGAHVELHFLDAPIETLFSRIQSRNREAPPISRQTVESWSAAFERPTPEEMRLFD